MGQCAVTACVARDILGGRIIRVEIIGDKLFTSHFYNELPDGTLVDLTAQQFSGGEKRGKLSYKEDGYAPASPQVRERYELLKSRVEAELLKRQKRD